MTSQNSAPTDREEGLLPCPFCGGEPTVIPSGDGTGTMIECLSPGCVNPHVSYYGVGTAAIIWNRRAPTEKGDGVVVVPREPTEAMTEAAHYASCGSDGPMGPDFPAANTRIWRAMLAARPTYRSPEPDTPSAWPTVTDAWANTYCELTGRDPDGQQVTFVDGGVVATFRDVAKREIEAMLCAASKPTIRAMIAATQQATGGEGGDLADTIEEAWLELGERDDRTSPEEYPEMCLINFKELAEFMGRAALATQQAVSPPEGVGETWESIAAWQRETFGPVALDRQARRAAEEMDELLADPTDVEEAADVCIVLAGYPGIREAIERKMAKNRARQWRLNGDGTGYHVKPDASQDHPHRNAADGGSSNEGGGETEQDLNYRVHGLREEDMP